MPMLKKEDIIELNHHHICKNKFSSGHKIREESDLYTANIFSVFAKSR